MPIYGALKKDNCPVTYDQLVNCLTNFEREQEGYIGESDLRHILENMGNSFQHLSFNLMQSYIILYWWI